MSSLYRWLHLIALMERPFVPMLDLRSQLKKVPPHNILKIQSQKVSKCKKILMHWGSLPTTYHIRIWYADVRVCVYKYRHIHVVYMRVCHYFSPRLSYARENQKTAKRQRVNFAMWYIVWPLDGRRVSVFVSSNCRPIHGAAFGCWL